MLERDPLQRRHVEATVRIEQGGSFAGTGLAIAPGQVVTCAHVVAGRADDTAVTVCVGDERFPATVRARRPAEVIHDSRAGAWAPDVAWLEISAEVPAYAQLDPEPPRLTPAFDKLWTAGFSRDYSGEPGLHYGAYDVIGQRPSPDGLHCTWQLDRGRVVFGLSGAGLLNLRSGLILGLLTSSAGVATDLGGWGVAAYPVLAMPEFRELRDLHDRHHERDRSWEEARRAAGTLVRASAPRSRTLGWAADRDEVVEPIRRAVRAFNDALGVRAVAQVQYLGSAGARMLGAPDGSSEADRVVANATTLVLVTDELAPGLPCFGLAVAAARAHRNVIVVSRSPDSVGLRAALADVCLEGELDARFLDHTTLDIQASIGLIMVDDREVERGAGWSGS